MPFDANSERANPVRHPDPARDAPPIEARIIDEALKILGPNGERWIKGYEADGKRNHCMIGAIKLARRRLKVKRDDTERFILNAIFRDDNAESFIETFNDAPGRCFDHVRETFLPAKCEALSGSRTARPGFEIERISRRAEARIEIAKARANFFKALTKLR